MWYLHITYLYRFKIVPIIQQIQASFFRTFWNLVVGRIFPFHGLTNLWLQTTQRWGWAIFDFSIFIFFVWSNAVCVCELPQSFMKWLMNNTNFRWEEKHLTEGNSIAWVDPKLFLAPAVNGMEPVEHCVSIRVLPAEAGVGFMLRMQLGCLSSQEMSLEV